MGTYEALHPKIGEHTGLHVHIKKQKQEGGHIIHILVISNNSFHTGNIF